MMTNLGYQDDVKYKFLELKLLKLPSLYIYFCIMYVKENLTKYEHNTREGHKIRIKCLKLTSSRNGTNYFGPLF